MTFINPRFTTVDMAAMNVEETGGNEVTIQARYEGVVFDAIVEPITEEVANMFGLPFSGVINGLNVSGPDLTSGVSLPSQNDTLSSLANVLNNSVNGGLIQPAFNIVNNVLNSGVGQINGIFGTPTSGSLPSNMSVNSLNTTGSMVPQVQNIVNAGQPATSVTTGNFPSVGNFTPTTDLG